MTSLAVLPSLKRSITDIMDEDLYHLPNSPIQFNNIQQSQSQTSTQQQSQQQQQRSDSPKPGFKNISVNSSPALNNSQLYTNNNLSNLLNIPDSFMDQYTKNSISSNNLAMDNISMNEDFYINQMNNNQAKINPFNDYGNPDTQINSYIKPQEIQKHHPSFNRRRRITTLDTTDSNSKSLKDEDYLLYNPDIQPSSLISSKNFYDDFSDSSLFIPNQSSTINNYPIPGYENDYLLIDDFDEDVEEELSDDEDDNYFYDDGEFDDLIMNDNNIMNMDNYVKQNNETKEKDDLMGGFLDDYGISNDDDSKSSNIDSNDNDNDSMIIDDDIETEQSSPIEFQDKTESPVSKVKGDSHQQQHHKSAAEISANNPNHQCDLINPSTGHPCNKQFSRPYDLIRHQETIHATKKKIFRCVICEGRLNGGPGNGKSKTFSRGDALSRHIKVKHGLVGQEALDIINEAKENVEYIYV